MSEWLLAVAGKPEDKVAEVNRAADRAAGKAAAANRAEVNRAVARAVAGRAQDKAAVVHRVADKAAAGRLEEQAPDQAKGRPAVGQAGCYTHEWN
jgi:hypothetical protein